LLGGEEALLGLGYFMEPSRGFFIRSEHYIIPQLSWGIMRFCYARRQLGIIEDSGETFMRFGT
jgi:hypothetical protein